MKTTVHVIPHSHWDREWYIPFEHHRARLVALLDSVLELLQTDEYSSYHLDGQTVALEDYLEIRPQKREIMEKLIREGRLKVGPWYVLQDTYLTSSEANVRNMLWGTRTAEKFGGVCKIGYLPDAFGNAGQFPQLLKQAGMKAAVFGRGVKLMGVDGVSDLERLCPRCSEFLWQSPDGSAIPSIYFVNWYNNGMEIPTDPEEAKKWWDERLAASRKYAATGHLLFMNGCDHQPIQRDLAQALETARKLYPDIEFVHAAMDDYADAVLSSLEEPLETVAGELEGQQTDGYGTLRNTASARWYIKALNRRNENLLEKQAEPTAAMAAMAGIPADGDMFDYAWKTLMQNHPHDSICGCSIDAVHSEMETRYHKSIQLTEWLLTEARRALADKISVPKAEAAFAVWNPGAQARTGAVSAVVGVERLYARDAGGPRAAYAELAKHPAKNYILTDHEGNEIPCLIEDLGPNFGYDLPDDRFRQPYYERQVRVTFEAKDVPAFGYAVYLIQEDEAKAKAESLVTGECAMENDYIRAAINADGTVDIFDKRTGRSYTGLGVFEDVGDVGDEYVFQQSLGEAITTKGVPAKITLTEVNPARAAFRVEHVMKIPAAADPAIFDAMREMRWRENRIMGRSEETVELKIAATYSLSRSGKQVEVHVELENCAKDHRLRMLFPTDVQGDSHYADSVFDVLKRTDIPGPDWVNPSRCDHMQLFVAAADEKGGLTVANRGQYEYEVLDDRKMLAVTLLRAVGELADWGVFPTPEAQCLGAFDADFALIPLGSEAEVAEGCRMAHEFQTELETTCILASGGELPAKHSFLKIEGDGLICTCFKAAVDGNGWVLRLFNAKTEPGELTVHTDRRVFRSDIMETCGDEVPGKKLAVGPKEIITVRIEG